MFSVESLPDTGTDRGVRADWQRLIDAGLPSAGRHPSESNRPHVTLAVRDDLPTDAVRELARVGGALPVECRLGGAVVFAAGERFVLARPLVMSAALLRLHADIVDLVGPPPVRYAVTAKDRWTPHITLARRMTAEQVGRALDIVGAAGIEGELTGLRLWDAEAKAVTPLR
ncbi:2'-5' RNA ligase family protein [Microbacterium sp. 2P01SA-2]|uniref:2'-5' RNA ligase family protein n=1 Tax=unclassified Microbacterium TaxID=2609290 RepID=UPI0039A140BB